VHNNKEVIFQVMALNRWHCSYGVTYIYLLVHKAASGSDGPSLHLCGSQKHNR